jgi:5-(hydroxymethyl)furfural/furfural oxidase
MGGTRVERLVFDGPKVTGVVVRRGDAQETISGREVIVSCGAIHSPVLLLRNGIGPGAELQRLGIPVVCDRRGVGKNLMEHPGVNFGCFIRPHARLPGTLRRQMFAGLRWSSGHADCPAGDMYIIPTNKAAWHGIGHRLGLLMLWVNRSFSTGEIRLTSPDPAARIDIDFNMCSDRRDLDRLVDGVKMLVKLADHPAVRETVEEIFPISYSDRARQLALYSRWNEFQTNVGGMLMDMSATARRTIIRKMIADAPTLRDLAADESVSAEWIKSSVLGHWHASCTCRMGAADNPLAVTDPSARVHGVEGLRVADASIMPHVPCANTHIPTIMVAEKVAAAIRAEH